MVKMKIDSSRESWFSSQHPHSSSQPSVNTVSDDPTEDLRILASSGNGCTCGTEIYIHINKSKEKILSLSLLMMLVMMMYVYVGMPYGYV